MKVFKTKERINFVDKNGTFIGWENDQHCCEMFGWFIKDKIINIIPPYEKVNEELLKAYTFDNEFFLEIKNKEEFDMGGMVIFKLKAKAQKPLYLHLYNHHNGYYSHGFEVKTGGVVVKTDLV